MIWRLKSVTRKVIVSRYALPLHLHLLRSQERLWGHLSRPVLTTLAVRAGFFSQAPIGNHDASLPKLEYAGVETVVERPAAVNRTAHPVP